MAMRMTEREKVQGRLEAAKVNGGAAAATPRGNDRYTVSGRTGTRYTVFAPSLETLVCDCKAGVHGGDCWHKASVYLRMLADRAIAT